MKDDIDLRLKKDFPEEIPVFGILVGDNSIIYYILDIIPRKATTEYENNNFNRAPYESFRNGLGLYQSL